MNILKDMGWSGDNKLNPAIMKQLGIADVGGYDSIRYKNEFARFTPAQAANFKKYYQPIEEDFLKKYPLMSDADKMRWKYQRYMQDYLGTIKAVDENVGRLLDYLEANNLMENTIIVYTSDQGFYLGEHGWYDKRFVYDESFKTPLLVAWPGKTQPRTRSDALVQNLDFAQTFLEAAGVPAPGEMQGESMIPLLTGNTEKWTRDEVYYHYYEYPAVHMVKRHYAIVTKEYKLVHYYFDADEWELIDRKKDPMELRNVYEDPEYAEIREDLHKRLEALRAKYKDNSQLSQRYIDDLMKDASDGKVFGVTKEKVEEIKARRSKIEQNPSK